MTNPWDNWIPGVLSKKQMEALVKKGLLKAAHIEEASIDLTLTDEAYLMIEGSVKPASTERYRVTLNNPAFAKKINFDADQTLTLECYKTYVFQLAERLDPEFGKIGIYGQATAKSSVGRMDVLARLIVDGMDQYESFNAKSVSTGDLYLEVTPFTFPVRVKVGKPLTQLRLFYGEPKAAEICGDEICRTIFKNDNSFGVGAADDLTPSLSVDLTPTKVGTDFAVAFSAKADDNRSPIPLWRDDPLTDPRGYWRLVKADENGRLKIENDHFYILRSKEKIRVPAGIAIYCKASDETIGEMRIHYAGFVHPWFGVREDGESGTPLIFEVRGHQVDVSLRDGERLANLVLYRMSEDAGRENSGYEKQTLQLSGFFSKWTDSPGEEGKDDTFEATKESDQE